jgi:hypothetical protein
MLHRQRTVFDEGSASDVAEKDGERGGGAQ